MQYYNINFGYTQVLFMGSVPHINRLLVIVPFITKVTSYDKTNKGVSIVFTAYYLIRYNLFDHT